MKLSNPNLRAFYVLAQEKNFSKAAKKIGLSQPAFSQRIMNLEKMLETILIVRNIHGISLTESGEKLLSYCEVNRQIEDEFIQHLSSDSRAQLKGAIRIGGFSSVMRSLLIPSLAKLLQQNPDLSIQTFTVELSDALSILKSSQVDFLLHSAPYIREGIRNELLGYENCVLVSSPKHPQAKAYLDHDENDSTTAAYFSLVKGALPKQSRYLDDIYGLIDGVKLGLGKAVVPLHLIRNEKLKIENPKTVLKSPVYLIYREAPYYTRLQQAVLNAIQIYFKENLV